MAKGDFGNIKRSKSAVSLDEFVESAKVDGGQKNQDPASERRGKFMIDPETGKKIALGGKVLEVPLNAYEVDLLTRAARDAGLPVATYVRSAVIRLAKDSINRD